MIRYHWMKFWPAADKLISIFRKKMKLFESQGILENEMLWIHFMKNVKYRLKFKSIVKIYFFFFLEKQEKPISVEPSGPRINFSHWIDKSKWIKAKYLSFQLKGEIIIRPIYLKLYLIHLKINFIVWLNVEPARETNFGDLIL